MKKIFIKFWPIILIFAIWIIFSSPFFIKGVVPYPSLYQSNFFSPWSAYALYEGPVKNNAMPDIITQIYPWRNFTVNSLKSGELPLWNPYNFSGTPHLANYQSAALFPLNLIFFTPLNFLSAWSILVLLQPLLAGLFMYIFLKSLRITPHGSLIGAISFMFCGFLVTWMSYATLGYAILFLPLALFAINKFFDTSRLRYLFLMSATVPLSFFAGHFQTSIYFALVVFSYLLFISLQKKSLRKLMFSLLFFLSGVLIAMLQIIPSIEFYAQSVRQEIITQLEVIPLIYAFTLFAPDFFGNPVTRNDWFGHYAEWNGYAGLLPLLLAVFAVIMLFRKNKKIWFFSILGAVSFLLAFQTPINDLLFSFKLPVLSTSASGRIIVIFSFSVATLAAFGFDTFINFVNKASFRKIAIIILVSIITISAAWVIPLFKILADIEKNEIAQSNLIIPTLIILGFIISLVMIYFFRKKKQAVFVFIFLVIILVSFDMLRFAAKWTPFDPPEHVFARVPIEEFYEKNITEQRFLGAFSAENSLHYKIQSLGGYDPLYPGRYGEFVKYIDLGRKEKGDRSVVNFPYHSERTDKAINFLGVKFIPHKRSDSGKVWAFPFQEHNEDRFGLVYEDEAYQVFENKEAFPRAFVVNDYVVEENDLVILEKMFDEDTNLRQTVILEKNPQIESSASISAKIEIIEYSNNHVGIGVETDSESILVLTDNYYPGWKAYVNDIEVEILRANYTFRAIIVPSGKSNVRFVYEPKSFKIGVYAAILGGLIILATVAVYNRKYKYGKN